MPAAGAPVGTATPDSCYLAGARPWRQPLRFIRRRAGLWPPRRIQALQLNQSRQRPDIGRPLILSDRCSRGR